MSQDSGENFGVKTQISIGAVGGRGRGETGGERKEGTDMLRAG